MDFVIEYSGCQFTELDIEPMRKGKALSHKKTVYEVVVLNLFRALMGLVREMGLDYDQAEEVFRRARSLYGENPYTTAIFWASPQDKIGESNLLNRFRTLLKPWLEHHGVQDDLAGLLHRYLRDEIVEELNTVARLRQHEVLQGSSAELESEAIPA